MKNIVRRILPTMALIALMSIFALEVGAQSKRSTKESSELSEHLWYGGSMGLGFQSFNSQSSFLFALFPMMGYKITESISIGPRLGASYRFIKSVGRDGSIYKFNPIELSGAMFGRAKVFNQFFAHIEYELANEKNPVGNLTGGLTIRNRTDTNFYVGAGYNSGGKVASEIYILYNLLEDGTTLEVPFVIRGGFTYKF